MIRLHEDKPHELVDGDTVLLTFRWNADQRQYVTDRGELLGADWSKVEEKGVKAMKERKRP